jgi:hypothetical protein
MMRNDREFFINKLADVITEQRQVKYQQSIRWEVRKYALQSYWGA